MIIAAIVGAGVLGIPAVKEVMDTVSTDDAFVQGHITYVSPRVEGLVTEVLVDQNDRVEAGELLVKLDREPFEVAVQQAEASLEEARANVEQARARSVRKLPGHAGPITSERMRRRPCDGKSPR